MTNLITDANLKAHLNISDTTDDTTIGWAATAGSAWVRNYCQRSFVVDAVQAATARYFKGFGGVVFIDDATEITAVATDDGDDGTYSTSWATTEWWAAPIGGIGPDGLSGWPYTSLNIGGTLRFPSTTKRPGVKVTGKWGWTALPGAVFSAALMVSADYWQSKNGGGDMFDANGQYVPQRRNWAAINLLAPYVVAVPAVA